MIATQHQPIRASTLPPASSHYQPQASSSRPRPNRRDSPTLPPTLHRSPSSEFLLSSLPSRSSKEPRKLTLCSRFPPGSSSSSHLLSLLHPERSHALPAPIPRRLQTSPLILCEASPFHKRSLSSSSSSSSSSSPGSSPSPTNRMAPLPEVVEEEEKTGALQCNGRSPEEMKRVFEGLLFPIREEQSGRKFD